MTHVKVSDTQSTLQPSSVPSAPPRFGRRAFGRQRRMSPQILARHIAESIITHRQLGQDRPISFYTGNPELHALVHARLEATATAMP